MGVILELAGDLMQLVGVPPIQLPKPGAQVDVSALKQFVETVQTVVATIQPIVDALGGCDS